MKKDDILESKIIEYFTTNHNNQTSIIAKKFNCSLTYASNCIDMYLSKKSNYMGAPINYNYNLTEFKGYEISVYDGENFIGNYISIKDAELKLGLKIGAIQSNIIRKKECTINHYSIGKKYTYKRL